MFEQRPNMKHQSPLTGGDHPELDNSKLLDSKGITIYQSLIGALQWVVSLGRIDMVTTVMTMSGVRVAPRKGHLKRVRRMVGYLTRMRDSAVRFRKGCPNYDELRKEKYDWQDTIYSGAQEVILEDLLTPLGSKVVHTCYVDANLMHDITTGKSVSATLHLLNQTPIDWFSKKQGTVETATYGSKFMAAWIAIDQIVETRITLRYLGVPLEGATHLFGDNQFVVNSGNTPHNNLHKRHLILSFHRAREAVAAAIVRFHYINRKVNPVDLLSKIWGYQQVKERLRTLLFWEGDTIQCDEQSK